MNSSSGNLPIDLHGSVLKKSEIIEHLDISQDEVLFYEVRIIVPGQGDQLKSCFIFGEAKVNNSIRHRQKNRLFLE